MKRLLEFTLALVCGMGMLYLGLQLSDSRPTILDPTPLVEGRFIDLSVERTVSRTGAVDWGRSTTSTVDEPSQWCTKKKKARFPESIKVNSRNQLLVGPSSMGLPPFDIRFKKRVTLESIMLVVQEVPDLLADRPHVKIACDDSTADLGPLTRENWELLPLDSNPHRLAYKRDLRNVFVSSGSAAVRFWEKLVSPGMHHVDAYLYGRKGRAASGQDWTTFLISYKGMDLADIVGLACGPNGSTYLVQRFDRNIAASSCEVPQ